MLKADRNKNRLIVALDVADLKTARRLIAELSPVVKIFKVGSQLFTACGPELLHLLGQKRSDIFLDLKFYDIPNTVACAVEAACRYKPLMLTVHTLGGKEMLQAAVKARNRSKVRTKILGVTILTSFTQKGLKEIGLSANLNQAALSLAKLAQDAGLDGVIASPRELELLRRNLNPGFIIVTPGIRPAGAKGDDQKRTMQPKEAIRRGADYIVAGRPITQAKNPRRAAEQIIENIT